MPDTTPQVHTPHEFHLAWALALLATGRKTGKEALDNTVWIEAHPDRTLFHSSNGGNYIRVEIPTNTDSIIDGGVWRRIVHDPGHQVRDIAAKCRQTNPTQQDFTEIAAQLVIHPIGDHVLFEYRDDLADSTFASTLPILDIGWPHEVIKIFDDHETDPTAQMAWPPASAAFIHGVGKMLGRTIPVRLNALTCAFDVTHPEIPDVAVKGIAATKAA